ncbi:MAG: hypothetical protein Tsb002_08610 [Wenzhouxiangellaceae bacterium]
MIEDNKARPIIKLAPEVYDDLRAIHDWIAKDSPTNATRYIRKLVEQINRLNTISAPGVARDDLLPGIQRVNVDNYAILLRIPDEHTVEIIQVIHGSRDIPRHIRYADEPLQ